MKDLFSIVSGVQNCQFAQITYASSVKMPKAFGVVTKVNSTNVQINFDYVKAVKNRIAKSGGNPDDFKGESLPWGQWELQNKVITHKGNRYLRFYANKNAKPITQYFVDGVPATSEQIAEIKARENTKSAKQSAAGLDDNQVIPRCVAFSNVRYLAVNGVVYTADVDFGEVG